MRKPKSPRTNTRKSLPKTGTAKPKRNLVIAAKNAAAFYAKISREYTHSADGYRTKLYVFTGHCYSIGRGLSKDLSSYERLLRDKFWNDVRQKPKDNEIMKAVLAFAMNAKSPQLQNRVVKTAAVLDFLAAENVEPQEVVGRLKKEGGIEKMYRKITGNRRGGLTDDVNILGPTLPEDNEGDGDEPDGWDTVRSKVDPGHKQPLGVPPRAKDASKNEYRSEPADPLEESDRSGGEARGNLKDGQPKQRRMVRFDREKQLAVELSERDLTWVLRTPQRIIIEAEVGEEDETGWRSVTAVSVKRAPDSTSPWLKPEEDQEDE